MKRLLSLAALIAASVLIPQLGAADLTITRAMLKDASGLLTIADVAGRVTTPAPASSALGITKAVHWFRLVVRKPAGGSKVVLLIRPSYLNEVRLYEAGPGDPRGWKTRVTGNHYPFRSRDRDSVSLGFVVDVPGPEATFYLRLKSRSPSDFSVSALEPIEAGRIDQQRDLMIVFFVTAMVLLLVWAILNYVVERQKVVGLFAVHQGTYLLFGMVAAGYLAPFAPSAFPQVVDWLNAILYIAINLTMLLFVRELLRAYDPPRTLYRGLNVILWVFPLLPAMLVMGASNLAMNSNGALLKITWLYFAVISVALRKEGSPSRRLLQVFFTTFLFSNVISWIARTGTGMVADMGRELMHLLIVDGLLISGLFAMMLHARARQIRREVQQAALDLQQAEQNLRIEQELKKQAEIQAHTDYLTGVYNRRYFVESAERELTRSIRFGRPLTLLMIDIDHFKAVNDTWGHSTGDLVLQKVTQLIRDTLRDQDIFGRTGGEEFSVVIVEIEGDEAFAIAQRLCDTVEHTAIVTPQGDRVSVTLSIGLAQLGGRSAGFDAIMNEADRAVYEAKRTGRNRVVVDGSRVERQAGAR